MIRRHTPIILLFVMGIVLSVMALLFVQTNAHERRQSNFKLSAHERLTVLERDFFSTFETLHSLGGLFDATPQLSRTAFHKFTAPVFNRYPSIQALEWIPRVTIAERLNFEFAAQQEGFPKFKFTERQAQGKMIAVGERDEYFPVYFVEPVKGNELALGFDLGSNPARRQALEQARDRGKMVATARITLVQETKAQFGFLVFKPIYRVNIKSASVEERRNNLLGFVLGVFRIGDMIENSMSHLGRGSQVMNVFVFDKSAPMGKQLLYPKLDNELFQKDLSADCVSNERNVAGRKWSISFCPSKSHSRLIHWEATAVFMIGVVLSGLLAFYLRMIIVQRETTVQLVEQRTAELAESESRVRAIVNTVVDGIISIDTQGIVLTFNPAAERIFEYTAVEAIGQNVKVLMPSPYHENHDAYVANYIHTGDAKVIGLSREVVGRRKDGSTFPMSLAISDVELNNKRFFVGIVRDITLYKEAAEALHIAKDRAEAANRAKAGFLAMMSHEIRTPLNGVLGVLGLLDDTKLDGEQKNYVQTARRSGEGLLDIISDILDFSKMEADKLEFEKNAFALKPLMSSIIDMLVARADEQGNQLNLDIDTDVPEFVEGDPGRLRQVLLNLASNAVKYTEHGCVDLKIKTLGDDHPNHTLLFSVHDTGIGIAKEKHGDLFAEFTTLDPSYSRKYGGTGLGLAISKKLAENMNGNLSFESDLGQGSTFYFSVCLPPANKADVLNLKPTSAREPDRKLRILLAEDNPTNRMVARSILEKAGHYVDAAENGLEAVEAVKQRSYDVVLMDVSMPEMDGLQATAHIRQLPGEKAKIPIIAMTAHAMPGDREDILAAGLDDYLPKPVSREAVLDALARWTCDKPENTTPDIKVTHVKAPIFDKSALITLAEDTDASMIPTFLESFFTNIEERMEHIKTAIETQDAEVLELECHTIRSSSATFGALHLNKIAQTIEEACRAGDTERAFSLVPELQGSVADAFEALKDYLDHFKV